jgi:hypothetical protein
VGRELSNDVKEFIADHVHSVLQLEALLLLSQNTEKVWSAGAVGRILNLSPESAKAQLDELLSQNRLMLVDGADEDLYRYNLSSDELHKTIMRLGSAYEAQRIAVLSLILAKPADKVRLFTETFRMIKGTE